MSSIGEHIQQVFLMGHSNLRFRYQGLSLIKVYCFLRQRDPLQSKSLFFSEESIMTFIEYVRLQIDALTPRVTLHMT